jgi:hypothetical protein
MTSGAGILLIKHLNLQMNFVPRQLTVSDPPHANQLIKRITVQTFTAGGITIPGCFSRVAMKIRYSDDDERFRIFG